MRTALPLPPGALPAAGLLVGPGGGTGRSRSGAAGARGVDAEGSARETGAAARSHPTGAGATRCLCAVGLAVFAGVGRAGLVGAGASRGGVAGVAGADSAVVVAGAPTRVTVPTVRVTACVSFESEPVTGATACVAVDVVRAAEVDAAATTGAVVAVAVAAALSTVFVTVAVAVPTGCGALGTLEAAVDVAFATVAVLTGAGAADVTAAGDGIGSDPAQAGSEHVPATTSAAAISRQRGTRGDEKVDGAAGSIVVAFPIDYRF